MKEEILASGYILIGMNCQVRTAALLKFSSAVCVSQKATQNAKGEGESMPEHPS